MACTSATRCTCTRSTTRSAWPQQRPGREVRSEDLQKMLDPMLTDAAKDTPLYGRVEVGAPA